MGERIENQSPLVEALYAPASLNSAGWSMIAEVNRSVSAAGAEPLQAAFDAHKDEVDGARLQAAEAELAVLRARLAALGEDAPVRFVA